MLKILQWVLVLTVLMAVGGDNVSAQSRRQPNRDQPQATQQQPTADQRGTQQSPAFVKVLPADDAEAKAKQEAEDRAAKENLDTNTIRLAIIGVIVAFLQFAGLMVQAYFLWKGIGESKTAIVATQRAFVFIRAFETHNIGNFIRVLPQWENSGSTPTVGLHMWASWSTFPGDLPEDFAFPDLNKQGGLVPPGEVGPEVHLGPKATMYAEVFDIDVGTVERLRLGNLRLFIWGWSQYRDVFDNTPLHRTEFCNEMVVTGIGQDGDKVTAMFAFPVYIRHNSAN